MTLLPLSPSLNVMCGTNKSFIQVDPDDDVCFRESKWSEYTIDLYYLKIKLKRNPDSLKRLLDFINQKTHPTTTKKPPTPSHSGSGSFNLRFLIIII